MIDDGRMDKWTMKGGRMDEGRMDGWMMGR